LNESLGIYRQHDEQQIGPVLHKSDIHATTIRVFYRAQIPILNLILILRREYRAGLFHYLKHQNNKKALLLLRKAKIDQFKNCFRWQVWGNIFSKIIEKIKQELGSRY